MMLELAGDQIRRGRLGRGADVMDRLVAQSPTIPLKLFYRSLLRLGVGDRAGCAALLGRLKAETGPDLADMIAWQCVLGPDVVADPAPVVRLAEIALAWTPDARKHLAMRTLGAALYRAGRHSEAIERLAEGIRLRGGPGAAQDWAFLAMAYQGLGDADAARHRLRNLDDRTPSTDPKDFWDELQVALLHREAEARVRFDPIFPTDPFAP